MDWDRWREEFPITARCTHFNHAGVSPVSQRVVAATTTFLNEATVLDRTIEQRWSTRTEAARAGFAQLVGAQADEIAFVKNTSEGLSLIAAGIDGPAGENVIAVDGEYPSNVYPWFALRRWGVETRMVRPVQGLVRVEDVRALVDGRTRLVAVSFVDWSSGGRSDLQSIGDLCRS